MISLNSVRLMIVQPNQVCNQTNNQYQINRSNILYNNTYNTTNNTIKILSNRCYSIHIVSLNESDTWHEQAPLHVQTPSLIYWFNYQLHVKCPHNFQRAINPGAIWAWAWGHAFRVKLIFMDVALAERWSPEKLEWQDSVLHIKKCCGPPPAPLSAQSPSDVSLKNSLCDVTFSERSITELLWRVLFVCVRFSYGWSVCVHENIKSITPECVL